MSKQQVEDAAEEEKESAEDSDGDDAAAEQLKDTAEDSDGERTGTGPADKSPVSASGRGAAQEPDDSGWGKCDECFSATATHRCTGCKAGCDMFCSGIYSPGSCFFKAHRRLDDDVKLQHVLKPLDPEYPECDSGLAECLQGETSCLIRISQASLASCARACCALLRQVQRTSVQYLHAQDSCHLGHEWASCGCCMRRIRVRGHCGHRQTCG